MRPQSVTGLFSLSLLTALWFQFMPLPESLSVGRPLCLALILGYWALYGPNVPVLVAALLLGLASDTLHNAPLGQHVVALALLSYTLTRLRPLLGIYPIWQVTLLLMPAWALYVFLIFLLDGMARHPSLPFDRLLPALISTFIWPLLVLLMDALRGKRLSM